jgi:uncharacterized repeat protein (TIGR03803 family)
VTSGVGNGNLFSVGTDGTGYTNLVSFTGNSGAAIGQNPNGDLTLSGTTLYGMTATGGNGSGNIFGVGTSGTNYQNLVSFSGTGGAASGSYAAGGLTLSGTTFYGMTAGGGANGRGNVFSVGIDKTNFQNLLSFTGTGGAVPGFLPYGDLTLSGTTLYGMTYEGGAFGGAFGGYGTVFSVGTNGANYQNLLMFTGTGGSASGAFPIGTLALSGTTLYGVTSSGGTNSDGNIFSVGINGANYQNLLSFTGTGGAANGLTPQVGLTLSGTTFYGVTASGGTRGKGNIFSVGIDGTGYQNLYSFTGGTDGGNPEANLTLTGGTLFGTANVGGNLSVNGGLGEGTVFALALPTPTPEPGTLALVGTAVVACVSYRWRRTRMRRLASKLY